MNQYSLLQKLKAICEQKHKSALDTYEWDGDLYSRGQMQAFSRIGKEIDNLLEIQLEEETDRLIAAAPDLLEALKLAEIKLRELDLVVENEFASCRSEKEMEESGSWSPEVYAARSAIAKATGDKK